MKPGSLIALPVAGALLATPLITLQAQESSSSSERGAGATLVDPEGKKATNLSLRKEVERAIARGVRWLESQQDQKEGYWSEREHPAVTALAVSAILRNPARKPGSKLPVSAEQGLGWIASKAKSDGSISGEEGLATYNTSLGVMALLDAKDPKYDAMLLAANRFLVGSQHDYGKPGETDNEQDGGIGYGGSYKHSDLSNTQFALQALKSLKKKFENVEDRRDLDLDWDAAITFVSRVQQNPETNDADWVSKDKKDEGGFVYFPGNSKSEETLPDGRVALRSYGSMTYAGLMSFIYADMDKDDKRVRAALKWLRSNYTLEENPGMGLQGLYYYYHTMAKALNAYGLSEMELIDGTKVDWRRTLALHMFNIQKPDGHFVNDNGRWWEKDAMLVTSYAVLTLIEVHEALGRE